MNGIVWPSGYQPSSESVTAQGSREYGGEQSVDTLIQDAFVLRQIRFGVATENNFANRRKSIDSGSDSRYGDASGQVRRVPVDAGTDTGKRHRGDIVARCEFDATAIARREENGFVARPAVPDGAHGVNDVTRREAIRPGQLGLPGSAAPEQHAFAQQLGTRSAVNRSVYSSTAEQRRIGGVDDRIDRERRNVAQIARRVAAITCPRASRGSAIAHRPATSYASSGGT